MKKTIHPWWYYSYYDKIFSYNRNYDEEIDIISQVIPIKSSNVQEIGAGTGNHSTNILKHKPSLLEVIDYDSTSINLLKSKFDKNSSIKYLEDDGFTNLVSHNPNINLIISTFSITQQVKSAEEFIRRCLNVMKRLINSGSFVFEFIDYEIAKHQFKPNVKNKIYSNNQDEVYISSQVKDHNTIIQYSGMLNNKIIFYEVELLNLTCDRIQNEFKAINCLVEFKNISSDGRRKFCFVKRSFSLKKTVAIIGPSGVGKSSLGKELSKRMPIKIIDLDDEFKNKYGEIEKYGNKHGWKYYFEKQSEIIQNVFNSQRNGMTSIIIVPASALYHKEYMSISIINRDSILNRSIIVCILAHKEDDTGAKITIARQLTRGYKVDEALKLQQYLYQSEYYKKIADLIIINDKIKLSVENIISYIINE